MSQFDQQKFKLDVKGINDMSRELNVIVRNGNLHFSLMVFVVVNAMIMYT